MKTFILISMWDEPMIIHANNLRELEYMVMDSLDGNDNNDYDLFELKDELKINVSRSVQLDRNPFC